MFEVFSRVDNFWRLAVDIALKVDSYSAVLSGSYRELEARIFPKMSTVLLTWLNQSFGGTVAQSSHLTSPLSPKVICVSYLA